MIRTKVFNLTTSISANIERYETFIKNRAGEIDVISVNTLGNNIILTYEYKKDKAKEDTHG